MRAQHPVPPSFPPTAWMSVVRDLDIAPTLRTLALLVATYADADGRRVRPTRATLVRLTGLTDRQVKDGLRELRGLGVLHLWHAPTGPGDAAEYLLTLPLDLPKSRPHFSTTSPTALRIVESA